jgi:hypothetical protein
MMEDDIMLNYLANNPGTVAAVISVVAALILAVREGSKAVIAKEVYELVCIAERQITGTKRGQERKAAVVKCLHNMLPPALRLFITDATIDNMIETAVKEMKAALQKASTESKDTADPEEDEHE